QIGVVEHSLAAHSGVAAVGGQAAIRYGVGVGGSGCAGDCPTHCALAVDGGLGVQVSGPGASDDHAVAGDQSVAYTVGAGVGDCGDGSDPSDGHSVDLRSEEHTS